MDYKERYEKALERARKIHNEILNNEILGFPDQIREIFPELAESEDERIRKKLIEIIGYFRSRGIDQQLCEEFITYLEKQKEQKPNIELIQRSWYMEGYHDREFGNEPKWILKTGEGGPKHELNPKYGQSLAEQKPAEWSDYKDKVNVPYCSSEPEWSEEDEDMRLEAIRVLVSGCERYRKESGCLPGWHKVIDWLKSLHTPPKQEWSEEDEKIMQTMIKDGDLKPSEIAFLKSLRPSWKPSEIHKTALLMVIRDPNNAGSESCQLALRDLLEQLKKL